VGTGVTRREFLKGTGATLGGLSVPHALDAAGLGAPLAAGTEPAPVEVVLDVNGRRHVLAVEPRTTLLGVLRGPLGLTGTKLGCDRGACSACTVLLGGRPVLSCMLLAVDVAGRPVTTVEGLARDGGLHPVQAAFVEYDAVQCGFCMPGMLMSCVALLDSNPNPGVDDVKAAIAGHFCRCGTYPHVVDAVRAAAGLAGS